MKVLMINSVCGTGSTGRICVDLAKQFEDDGSIVKIAYGREGFVPDEFKKYAIRIGNTLSVKLHALKTRITDKHGLGSKITTKQFLKWANEFDPDILWLHNIHGYYINYELLFKWIKSRPSMEVRWTLHDCWAFTGHCAYFTIANCSKWKTECNYCPQKSEYPKSLFFDNSKQNYHRKAKAFSGVKNLKLIAPSNWLANLVKQSFLKDYSIEVQYNKVNTRIFRPTPSDFRTKNNLQNKFVILGVANGWGKRKGFDDFIELSHMLDNRYAIVLVGVNDKQIKDLPSNIVGIKKTNNSQQLAEIYTAADIFVNPSKEETFGMTTLEAQACGTYTIVYVNTACEEVSVGEKGVAVDQSPSTIFETIKTYFAPTTHKPQ